MQNTLIRGSTPNLAEQPVEHEDLLSSEDSAAVAVKVAETAPDRRPTYLLKLRGREFGRPWMAVVGACVAMLGLGAQSTWSTLSIFVSAPGILAEPSTTTIWAYATAGMMAPVSMMLAPMLHQHIGYAATAALGSLVAGGGLMLAGLVGVVRSFWLVLATFGVLFGIGNGFLYVSCVIAAQSWFPKRRGLIAGVVLACFATSAFMYNLLAKAIANPHNLPTKEPTDPEAAAKWRELYHEQMTKHVPNAFLVIGGITLTLGLLGSMFVHPAPQQSFKDSAAKRGLREGEEKHADAAKGTTVELDHLEEGAIDVNATPRTSFQEEANMKGLLGVSPSASPRVSMEHQRLSGERVRWSLERVRHSSELFADAWRQMFMRGGHRYVPVEQDGEFTPSQMLKTPQFWMLYAVESFAVTATLLVLGSFADFARREASFEAPFALVGGVAALSNAAGRITWGTLADLIDYRRTFVLILSLATGLLFVYFETRKNVILWSIVTCAVWFCYGGLLALLPTAVADAFGVRNQSRNYSILYTSLAIGSLVQALLLTTLLEVLGSYRSLFWITGGLAALADIIMIAYKPPGRGKWFAIWTSYKRKN